MRAKAKQLLYSLITFSVAVALAFMMNCGGDESEDETNNAEGGNTFSGTIEGQNAPGSVSASSDQAQKDLFGATISGNVLYLYILTGDNPQSSFLITGQIVTSDENPLPGTLSIDGDAVIVNATDNATGTIYEATSGFIKIDNCPPSQNGSTVSGSFQNVKLANVANGQEALTLNGDFVLQIYSVINYAIVCTTNGGSNTNTGGTTSTCSFDPAGDCTGPCCPYLQCVEQCVTANCTQVCSQVPPSMDCLTCMGQCDQNCQSEITPDCQSKLNDLQQCMNQNGCSDYTDECTLNNCCDQLKAAFQP